MKPIRTILISLLILASAACAQPWQWQLYEGDFYNPTGFFDPPVESVAVGDFNGDSVDEVIWVTGNSFQMAERDSQTGHWSVTSGSFPIAAGLPVWTGNLDSDPADELVTLGPHFFNATNDNPWIWEEFTPEPGIVQVCSNPWIRSIVLGDYDSDGQLNAVILSGWEWEMVLTLLEQNESGTFTVETSFDSSAYTALFDGDFDHDGDIDFATVCEMTDVPFTTIVGENTPGGLVVHEYESWSQPFAGPTGGDLDSDGQWEGLFRYSSEGYRGYHAVEFLADSTHFVVGAGGRYLGRSTGPILGNFRAPDGPVIACIRSYSYGDPFFEMDAFYLMSWSLNGWCCYSNGFYSWMGDQCRTGTLADLNGDGLRDICGTFLDTRWGGSDVWSWQLWQNVGNESADLYATTSGWVRLDTLFLTNPDTTFTGPEIGDITGDGLAELAVFAQPTNGEREILFYEFSGSILQPVFTQQSEWSNGLPVGLLSFHLADLDADDLCELIVKTEGGYDWGHWEIYFRRHEQWALYENILPEFSPTTIYFADLEGDGDLDLFTPGEVWINLSPDVADEPFVPHPSSFILSAYPNPFNAQTTITFTLPSAGWVRLELFDVLGRSARVLLYEPRAAGEHSFRLDASDLPTGIYFARLVGREQHTIKLMLLK